MGYDGAKKAIETTGQLISLANALWDHATGHAAGAGGDAGIVSSQKTLQNLVSRFQGQITQLEKDLQNCEPAFSSQLSVDLR